jgi:outer membrane murein-binding lipoprotein Lpp
MAGPTDLLNDDVKELKADLRDLRSSLDVVKADVHRIDVSLAELRSDVQTIKGIGKWAATLLVASVLASGGTVVWWAATVSADVKHLAAEVGELKKSIDTRKPLEVRP